MASLVHNNLWKTLYCNEIIEYWMINTKNSLVVKVALSIDYTMSFKLEHGWREFSRSHGADTSFPSY